MMDHDPIAVFLCRTIEASLAGPMVALQDGLTMSAEMLLVVMLAGRDIDGTSPGHDVERSAGAQEDRLNSFAARAVREVGEWRTHRSILICDRLRAAFRPEFRSTGQSSDFFDPEHFPAEKGALGAFIGDVLGLRHTWVPPKFSCCSPRRPDRGPGAAGSQRPAGYCQAPPKQG